MRKYLLYLILLLFFLPYNMQAQRVMDKLDRGLVALNTTNGVYLSWRIPGNEWYGVSYNVYRDGTKINVSPITGASNLTDASGTTSSTYTVTSIVGGVEQVACLPAKVLTTPYLEIPMRRFDGDDGYELNDCCAADLDGDGQYEIIVKRIYKDWSTTCTKYSYIEAYKLDGTCLWSINVGPNLLPDVEIDAVAYDYDGDGKAEVIMRTCDGTTFGDGTYVGDRDGDGVIDYRYSVNQTANMSYLTEGPEYLSLIDGATGKELDHVDYIPRISAETWGDSYGHRCNKFGFGAPYLDGHHPSILITRGIYTRIQMRTYDVVNKKLVSKWQFDATDSTDPYEAQGYHNYSIADVDDDGCDEIVYGSMCVDNDGKGLYSTQLGHGDASHVGDFDPYHKGLEVFACHEIVPNRGTTFRDAKTGEIFIHNYTVGDCGRCCAGNVTNDFLGAELWGGDKMYSASTRQQVGTSGGSENFICYWDGDLLQETVDHEGFSTTTGVGTGAIYKYGQSTPLLLATGTESCNYTKGTPCLQADILGDWRDELIWRAADQLSLRIYTTTIPTIHRIYTQMHDMQYRNAIVWQMCGYNQPPHDSYFLGEREGILLPPPPVMSNDRLMYVSGSDIATATYTKNDVTTAYADSAHLLFADNSGGSVSLSSSIAPSVLTVNSPGNYSLNLSNGNLIGPMIMVKQGEGSFTLKGALDYKGATQLYDGVTNFSGSFNNSKVWMNRFAELNTTGTFKKGLTMEYGAILRPDNDDVKGNVTIADSLTMKWGAIANIDVYGKDKSADTITINGDLRLDSACVFKIIPHIAADTTALPVGDYVIGKVTGSIIGDLSKVTIKGLAGRAVSLKINSGNLILSIATTRAATSTVWSGSESSVWDLCTAKNFLNSDDADVFVTGDNVIFNATASNKNVVVSTALYPSAVAVTGDADYTFSGTGSIEGSSTFTKSGTGALTVSNTNAYTGKTELDGGTITVAALANGTTAGSLGAYINDASNFVMNGVTIVPSQETYTNQPMTIGVNGSTLNVTNKMTLAGAIGGTGSLTKNGSAQLNINAANTYQSTILNSGTIYLANENAITNGLGGTIYFNGGTLSCFADAYSYSTANWNMVVNDGKTATLSLDSRCTYNGSLTGSGTINVYSPYSRGDLCGDWSAFIGNINATGADFRINNNYGGFPKAILNLASGTTAYNVKSSSVALGGLSGSGSLTGSNNWTIGARGRDCTFSGAVTDGSITKVGDDLFTMEGTGTYTGATIVNGGTLILNAGTVNCATGTGAITVNSGAILMGKGIINGQVNINDSATYAPGLTSVNTGTFTHNNRVFINAGGILKMKVLSNTKYDQLVVKSGYMFYLKGTLSLSLNNAYAPAIGDSLCLVNGSISLGSSMNFDLPSLPTGMAWDTSKFKATGSLFVVSSTTGIETPEWASDITLYPLPVVDNLHVTLSSCNQLINVSLRTLGGAALYETQLPEGTTTFEIPMVSYGSGVYLLDFSSKDGSITKKVYKK